MKVARAIKLNYTFEKFRITDVSKLVFKKNTIYSFKEAISVHIHNMHELHTIVSNTISNK